MSVVYGIFVSGKFVPRFFGIFVSSGIFVTGILGAGNLGVGVNFLIYSKIHKIKLRKPIKL